MHATRNATLYNSFQGCTSLRLYLTHAIKVFPFALRSIPGFPDFRVSRHFSPLGVSSRLGIYIPLYIAYIIIPFYARVMNNV